MLLTTQQRRARVSAFYSQTRKSRSSWTPPLARDCRVMLWNMHEGVDACTGAGVAPLMCHEIRTLDPDVFMGTETKNVNMNTLFYENDIYTNNSNTLAAPFIDDVEVEELSDERSMLIGKVNRHAFLESTVIAVTHVEPYEVAARRLQIEMALMKLSAFPKVILGGDFNTSEAKQIEEGSG